LTAQKKSTLPRNDPVQGPLALVPCCVLPTKLEIITNYASWEQETVVAGD